MRMIRLDLENFCQHRSLSIDFSPGMNLIVGPNGAGKSNILNAAYAALTGDPRQDAGTKTDSITQGIPRRAVSRSVLEIEHNNRVLTATCGLRPAVRSVTLGDDPTPVAGADLVNDTIESVLGVSRDVLTNYVFVGQHDLFGVFSTAPARRTQMLHRLFGLERAENIWNELGDSLSLIPPPPATDVARARTEYDAAKQDLQDKQALAAQFPFDVARRRVTESDDAVRTLRAYHQHQGNLQTAAQLLTSAADAVRSADTRLLNATDASNRAQTEAQVIPQLTIAIESARKYQEFFDQLTRAKKALDDLVDPVCPSDYLTVDNRNQATTVLDQVIAKVTQARQVVSQYESFGNKATCPTCGQSVESFHKLVDDARKIMGELQPLVDAGRSVLQRSTAWDSSCASVAALRVERQQTVKSLEDALASCQSSISAQEVQEATNLLSKLTTDLANSSALVRACQLEKTRVQNSLAETQAKFDELNAVAVVAPTKPIEQITAESTAATEELVLATKHAEAAKAAEQVAADRKKRLEEAELDSERAEEFHRRRVILTGMRSLFHRNALPRIMAANMMRQLVNVTNQFLDAFGPPFYVISTEEGEFQVNFADGREQPVGRLSGGQRVVLSLAFRLAVHATFASGIKLLCLDEPTVGLDEYNLRCLEEAFTRLREIARSSGLQVVVVTHETGIQHLFDRVIELPGVSTT